MILRDGTVRSSLPAPFGLPSGDLDDGLFGESVRPDLGKIVGQDFRSGWIVQQVVID